jgi:hypothetical protein
VVVPLGPGVRGLAGDDATAELQRRQGTARAHQPARRQIHPLLLVSGAVAVLRHTRNRTTKETARVCGLLARRPPKVTAVALAIKSARIAGAVMARGEAYRSPNEIVRMA